MEHRCAKLIIATGGLSYPTTGSTGDGYRIGHIKDGDSIHDFEELVEIHV